MYQAQKQREAQAKAMENERDQMVKNQNRLVEEGYMKTKQARGIGPQMPAGNLASQSGSVLTSVTDGNANSLV